MISFFQLKGMAAVIPSALPSTSKRDILAKTMCAKRDEGDEVQESSEWSIACVNRTCGSCGTDTLRKLLLESNVVSICFDLAPLVISDDRKRLHVIHHQTAKVSPDIRIHSVTSLIWQGRIQFINSILFSS